MLTRSRIRLALLFVGLSSVGPLASDLPPLDSPVRLEPPQPATPTPPKPVDAIERPALAIPGVTVPSTRTGIRRPPSVEPAPAIAVPPLDHPAGLQDRAQAKDDRGVSPRPANARASADRGRAPRSEVPRPGTDRPSGILGRLPSALPGLARERREPVAEDDDPIKVKPRNDPEADAVLKRRIEREAVAAAGNRARSIEVFVEGRRVEVRAKGVGFFRKRGVKKALEGLPSLKGLRASVDVTD